MARLADVPNDVLLTLVKMSDLARAGYVGPMFARLMYEAGADTLETLAGSSPEALFDKIRAVNDEQKLTKSFFTVKDMATCIEIARELPRVIAY